MKKIFFFYILMFGVMVQGHAQTVIQVSPPLSNTVEKSGSADVEFILDVSGSMASLLNGTMQIDSAKEALRGALQYIPAKAHVALRFYGHREEQDDKEKSCLDSELVVPFKEFDKQAIQFAMMAVSPKGFTPLAYSLQLAAGDFDITREAKKVIILLSDGEETCDGDPVGVLTDLKNQGFEVVVHTIGFNVDATTRAQLEAIADVSGGRYFDAQDADALNSALEEATQESFVIEKEKSVYGNEIRGGDSYETAVPLPELGVEYRLDHHQRGGEFDYFYIDIEGSQRINLEIKTLEKGIDIAAGEKETDVPDGGLALHSSSREELLKMHATGKFMNEKRVYQQINPDRLYILIGDFSNYVRPRDINKDHFTFTVSLESAGDLGGTIDAGSDSKTALSMEAQRYEENSIGQGDEEDRFSFQAKAGESYLVGVVPENLDMRYEFGIYDDFMQQIFSKRVSGGLKTPQFTIDADGKYFIHVKCGDQKCRGNINGYVLDLRKTP